MTGYPPPLRAEPPMSLQQTRYVRARRQGHARTDAAAYAPMRVEEAALIDKEMSL